MGRLAYQLHTLLFQDEAKGWASSLVTRIREIHNQAKNALDELAQLLEKVKAELVLASGLGSSSNPTLSTGSGPG